MRSSHILLLVVLGSLAVSIVIAWFLVRSARDRAAALLAPAGVPTRASAATCVGRSDEVADTLRGTGTLALTPDALAFAQWRPSRLLQISRSDIVRTDTTREHLGRTLKHDVLRVTWRTSGIEESVAFFVRDLDPWLHDLGGLRSPDT